MFTTSSLGISDLILTDGGIETTLIYKYGVFLREFAAFELLKNEAGMRHLNSYYQSYIDIAIKNKKKLILETPTWRASGDWGNVLGYGQDELQQINEFSVAFVRDIVRGNQLEEPVYVSGCVGPRGDGYVSTNEMTVPQAIEYHLPQVESFANARADVVTGITMTNSAEALALCKVCKSKNIPCVISFTVETDGLLPSGEKLETAIQHIDRMTEKYASYFMINCAHPNHFSPVFSSEIVSNRVKGVRANASKLSHEELDKATELDEGDAIELAANYKHLKQLNNNINVVGGCCGTSHQHIDEICKILDA